MKSLFIRVFFLLMGCFALVALISTLLFMWVSHELEPHERHFQGMSLNVAEQLIERYEDGELRKFGKHFRERFNGEFWIQSEQDKLLSSRPIKRDIESQVTDYPQVIYPYQNAAGRFFIFAHKVKSDDVVYKVIMTSHRPFFRGRNRIWFIGFPVVIVILGMASASALLSYWILRPIRKIRDTTRKFSADNMESRISEAVINRKDAFGELGREFNQMAARVQSAIDNQNQLLRDVSHELRSPLARIQVASSLAVQKNGPKTELDRIESEVEKLNGLIEDLITLSRLKNRVELEKENVDLGTLLSSVVDNANFEFRQNGKTAELTISEVIGIEANQEFLSSMFENVIRNGLRYTPENKNLIVNAKRRTDSVVVTVTDQGPGVDADMLDRIFDPFARADESRELSNGNHGIGLALAKTIAQLHGGTISARNVATGGLQVTIDLPVSGTSG
jgi:signal transduction histidine kinase